MRSILTLFAIVVVGCLTTPARAEFWSNPLGKGKSPSVSVNRSSKKASPTKAASKTIANLTAAPGELVSKTKQLLPSASSKAPKPASHSRTIPRAKPRDEKPSLLKSLFVNEPTPPPRTVGEWMALKRIDP